MKAGWCDFRYIANRPQHFRPPHNRHRLVTPGAALRSKLGYEQYRKYPPERTELPPEIAPNGANKRPKTVLTEKIGYDQFRPEMAATEVDNPPVEHAKTKQRNPSRAVHNHGLGANREEIVAHCEQFASRNILALSILFSVDPGLLALVDASGSDPQRFNDQCAEAFVPNVFSELGWGDTVEYAYVTHNKPDRLGRARLHNHMTVPGSVPDAETGQRRPLPYIRQTDIQQMQAIADRTVEQQLDLTLGREWRLQVPEYVHTYDVLRQEVVVDNMPDIPVVVSESVSLPPRDLFSSELDSALKKTIEGLPDAPTVLFDTHDLEFDDFGDPDVLAGLVADLFGDDFVPPIMPIQPATALPIEPNAIDERDAEPSVLAPESPILVPPMMPIQSAAASLAEPNTIDEGEVEPSVLVPESPILVPSSKASTGLQTPHLAVTLVFDWMPEIGVGTIQARTEWLDPATGKSRQSETVIYQTSVMDHVFFLRDKVIFEDALADTHAAWMTQSNTLNSAMANDPEQGLTALHRSWFETMALDGEALEKGFLPGVPRQYLPDGIDAPRAHWERLPGVRWTDDPETTTEYGVTARVADEKAGTFVLQFVRRWRDESDIQEVEVVREAGVPESLEASAQTVWRYGRQLEDDFADESRIVAQRAWREQFTTEVERNAADEELDEIEAEETENYPDASGSARDKREDKRDIDIDF